MQVRTARPDDAVAVRNVLDGALLALQSRTVEEATRAGDVLVAVREGDVVLGAVVLDGPEILAVAVRRRRRGQGIGTALVREAASRRGALQAEFHGRVRPFWESLGFEIEPAPGEDRFRGRLSTRKAGEFCGEPANSRR